MKSLVERPVGTVVLRAPAHGAVRWQSPVALCGELDVFEHADPVAVVGDVALLAPAHGFVRRLLVMDGDVVTEGAAIALFVSA